MNPSAHLPARPRPEPLWVGLRVEDFPAQALLATRDDLRDTPFVVVQQRADSHKAAVLSASPAARRLDVLPGVPVFIVRRKHGRRVQVVVRDRDAEATCHARLVALLKRCTPEYHVAGTCPATALLDLAGTPAQRHWGLARAGAELQRRLKARCRLEQVAAGVSTSRLVARVLAGEAGPDGVATCAAGAELQTLAGFDADHLPGLAAVCRERAAAYGLARIDQLLALDRTALVRRFGRDEGLRLYGLVRGLESEPRRSTAVTPEAETVLAADLSDERLLRDALSLTVDKACDRLRQSGQAARAVRLRLTYTDGRRAQRTARLAASTDDITAFQAAVADLFGILHVRRVALKAIGVATLRTSPATGQGDLFAGPEVRRRQRLGAALTDIRRRMGFGAVVGAGAVELARESVQS